MHKTCLSSFHFRIFGTLLAGLLLAACSFDSSTTPKTETGGRDSNESKAPPSQSSEKTLDPGTIHETVASNSEGGWSSGGGDELHFIFVKGREHALSILKGIERRSLGNSSIKPEIREWILQYQQQMISDLENIQLDWSDDEALTTCARTEYQPGKKIILSTRRCANSSYTKIEAGRLLIHELVHHQGVTEESFADQVAVAAYVAWEDLKLKTVPLCEDRSNMIAELIFGAWELDVAATTKLRGKLLDWEIKDNEGGFEFVRDLSVLDKIPGNGHCAISAGWIRFSTVPTVDPIMFFIPETARDSLIAFYPIKGGQPKLDLNRVSMIRALDPKNDILYMGGDYEWLKGYYSYRRKADFTTSINVEAFYTILSKVSGREVLYDFNKDRAPESRLGVISRNQLSDVYLRTTGSFLAPRANLEPTFTYLNGLLRRCGLPNMDGLVTSTGEGGGVMFPPGGWPSFADLKARCSGS